MIMLSSLFFLHPCISLESPHASHDTLPYLPRHSRLHPLAVKNRTESHVSRSDSRRSFLYILFRFSTFPITKVFPSDYMRLAASIPSVTPIASHRNNISVDKGARMFPERVRQSRQRPTEKETASLISKVLRGRWV